MTATTMTSPGRRPGPGRATPEPSTTRREARARGERTAYVRLELRRTVRDLVTMFFVVGLPAFMYVLFGASAGYSQENAGNGNVALYVMISMAAYGAVTATTSVAGSAATATLGCRTVFSPCRWSGGG